MASVMDQKNITWIKFGDDATIPTKGSKYSAGYDLYSSSDFVIPKRDREIVKTQIGVKVPFGYYGRIAPRSGSNEMNLTLAPHLLKCSIRYLLSESSTVTPIHTL